jgi:hypothetical protein
MGTDLVMMRSIPRAVRGESMRMSSCAYAGRPQARAGLDRVGRLRMQCRGMLLAARDRVSSTCRIFPGAKRPDCGIDVVITLVLADGTRGRG